MPTLIVNTPLRTEYAAGATLETSARAIRTTSCVRACSPVWYPPARWLHAARTCSSQSVATTNWVFGEYARVRYAYGALRSACVALCVTRNVIRVVRIQRGIQRYRHTRHTECWHCILANIGSFDDSLVRVSQPSHTLAKCYNISSPLSLSLSLSFPGLA